MHLRSLTHCIICVLAVASTVGCSMGNGDRWKFTKSWDVRKAIGLKKDELAPPQMPTRLVSTWTDTVLRKQGQMPQRGFGGRLLFFNEDRDDPIRVEGQLVVYAYDENDRAAHETHPTRRFVFPASQFVRHESESQVGPSYSVWLPWDEVGGLQKDISLIARFEPAAGPMIVGEQTRHLLPGTRLLATGETAPAVKPVGDIQLTRFSHESELIKSPESSAPAEQQRPAVTSISLSGKSWEQRLKAAQKSAMKEPTKSPATVSPKLTPQ